MVFAADLCRGQSRQRSFMFQNTDWPDMLDKLRSVVFF